MAINKENNKIKKTYTKEAFTLVEIMVAIVLTTVVLTTAYQIWSKIRRDISRSTTRQRLQNELRKVANYMQNDFKSIKASGTFDLQQPSETSFTMTFEKFKEIKEDEKILAQDNTEKVTYELKNNMLTRNVDGKQILTLNCDGISIERTVSEEGNPSNDNPAYSDADFLEGRKAKLDITITGKMKIPGINDEEYHVEKTSVVMRDEYNKNVNKTYLSNFELAKKEVSEISKEGETNNFGGGALSYEYLLKLNNDALDAVENTQNDYLNKTKESLEKCNENIKNTETGQGFWSSLGDTLAFWSTSDEERVEGWRDQLVKATTQDEIVGKDGNGGIKKELVDYRGEKEESYLQKSYSGYNSLTSEQKEIYKAAYDMKVQDRTAQKAYEKQKESDPNAKPSPLMIDMYKEGANSNNDDIKDSKGNKIDLSNSDNQNQNQNQNKDKANKIIAAYDALNLDWMDEGDFEQDLNTYAAAKSLISQADTKVEILGMINMYNENLQKISKARVDPNRNK